MTTATRAGRGALRATALCGGCAALALLFGGLAAMGFLGGALASQSLLANLKAHLALVSALCWLGAAAGGWRIAGIAGALGGAGMIAAAWADVPRAPLGPVPDAALRAEIILFNVYYGNPNGAAIAAFLADSDADAVVILEASALRDNLKALAARFSYRFGCESAACDTLVLSRWPIAAAAWEGLAHAPQRLASVRIETPGGPLTLFAAHWDREFFSSIRTIETTHMIRRILTHSRSGGGPYVLLGDFNALPWDPSLARAMDVLELRVPASWTPTWPVGAGFLGAQIDHVLTNGEAAVEALGALPDHFGSNHRGLRATVAVRSARR